MGVNDIVEYIKVSIKTLMNHSSFTDWTSSQTLSPRNHVVVNNSFVFRDVKTVKSEKYLALTVNENNQIDIKPSIAKGLCFNLDFKHYTSKSINLLLTDLDTEVEQEMAQLGYLLFILIGHIEDRTILNVPLGNKAFQSVSWDPTLVEPVHIDDGQIVVNEVHDEDTLWQKITEHYQSAGNETPDGLREAFGVALDKLQEQALAELHIPPVGKSTQQGITDVIVETLREQRNQYSEAVSRLNDSDSSDSTALNEILRTAYNFASDANGYLKLIVSICDLKPIVLWGTIAEHYALSEAFRHLPWTRSRNKPSLKNYNLTIADARNSSFHNLFPFQKTLNVHLPERALRGAELRIFSEYTKKKENLLIYKDKALVDVLVEFTRARERRVAPRFWRQNLKVMDATIALFAKTSEFVKVLYANARANDNNA